MTWFIFKDELIIPLLAPKWEIWAGVSAAKWPVKIK